MPSYFYICDCGHETEVNPARAGTNFICLCGNERTIPSLRHLKRIDLAIRNADTQQLQGTSGIKINSDCHNWRVKVFTSPRIEIDGIARRGGWGSRLIELPPGEYIVRIYVRWFFMKCAASRMKLKILENHVREIDYLVPYFPLLDNGEVNVR
jgi:hypothetical protein